MYICVKDKCLKLDSETTDEEKNLFKFHRLSVPPGAISDGQGGFSGIGHAPGQHWEIAEKNWRNIK